MCNENKDFSLLRPFDLDAVKDGQQVCYEHGGDGVIKYLAGPDNTCRIAYEGPDNRFYVGPVDAFRMAPLCWVRTSVEDDTLKPVYKGDVLWHKCGKEVNKVIADSLGDYKTPSIFEKGSGIGWHIECLTFTPPKVKRKVKMLGYKDVFDGGILLRGVVIEDQSYWERFPQIDTTIEIDG